MGATGMSSISGNFYPEVLVWMVNNATNPGKKEEVKWLQAELSRVDPIDSYSISYERKILFAKTRIACENDQPCSGIAANT
jgi:4-hydroxy-tetrahydrodipicolinate synthase